MEAASEYGTNAALRWMAAGDPGDSDQPARAHAHAAADEGPSTTLPAAWIAGNRAHFEILYRETWSKTVATLALLLGSRAAAEDCAQDTYRKAWAAWPRWKPAAPPEAWVHRIAVRVASNHRSKERLRGLGETLRRFGRPDEGPDPSEAVPLSDVATALRKLPTQQASLLVLRHVHGYSNRELAEVLNVPERTVASRLITARRKLATALGPGWDFGVSTPAAPPVVEGEDIPNHRGKNQSHAREHS